MTPDFMHSCELPSSSSNTRAFPQDEACSIFLKKRAVHRDYSASRMNLETGESLCESASVVKPISIGMQYWF